MEAALVEEIVGVDTCGWMGVASEISGPLDLLILGAGDVLDKIDNGTSKLRGWNLHERFGELEPILRCEII